MTCGPKFSLQSVQSSDEPEASNTAALSPPLTTKRAARTFIGSKSREPVFTTKFVAFKLSSITSFWYCTSSESDMLTFVLFRRTMSFTIWMASAWTLMRACSALACAVRSSLNFSAAPVEAMMETFLANSASSTCVLALTSACTLMACSVRWACLRTCVLMSASSYLCSRRTPQSCKPQHSACRGCSTSTQAFFMMSTTLW
mmetsp:Transcript_71550/g.115483  ORF Transcript_71550/g.115483 Transcript_71550/m.115483 type:complete len:201 (-) Transcript_71550:609-1211(-)